MDRETAPNVRTGLAAMPTTSLTGALDPVGRQELLYGQWTIGEHWSTDSGSAESGYVTSDRIENINRNYDVYAQWTFTPQEVALWIVDHEEADNGSCYLVIEPQFKLEESIQNWIRRTIDNGQLFVKYCSTREECEAATPIRAYEPSCTARVDQLGIESNP